LKAAAQQFETLFLQMVLKSMRDAVPQDGLFNSDQSRFYTGMLDQQMAQNLATSGKGVGFAKLIEQQLGRQHTRRRSAIRTGRGGKRCRQCFAA
jgi:flagellar protein FlgJ